MDFIPNLFIRQQEFTEFKSFKRVTQEGSGPVPVANTIIRYDQVVHRADDFFQTSPMSRLVFRVNEAHLRDGAGISALNFILLSMRVAEEAWILIPAGFHQEKNDIWEDLIFFIKVVEFERIEVTPPHKQSFIAETSFGPDNVLTKRLISEGKGQSPPINYLVTYYYTVYKEDGTEHEQYTPKSHILPRIPTQDTHLAIYYTLLSMKEGEDCIVLAPPGYFKYRSRESLWVSIQLLYISEPQNCCYPNTIQFIQEFELAEGMVKRLIKEGSGPVIESATKYWIELEGWLEDSYQFQKFKEECVNMAKENKNHQLCTITLLRTMKKGEVALVKCPPGTHLYDDTLENETLWLKYTLKDYLEHFEDPMKVNDLPERLELCKKIKDSANRLFRSGIKSDSRTLYNKVKSSLIFKTGFIDTLDGSLKSEILSLRSTVTSNLALVFLKDAEEFWDKDKTVADKNIAKVFELTNSDLEANPKNAKSLFRRSKAYLMMEEYEKASMDVTLALEVEPSNKDCLDLLRHIKQRTKIHDNKQRGIFREVFKEENWKRESEKDEERKKRIEEEYEMVYEKEQEEEINNWIKKLQTKGITLQGDEAVNLLMEEED